MNLQHRKDLLIRLGDYLQQNEDQWQQAKHKAFMENNWFIPEFIDVAVKNIADNFLQTQHLEDLSKKYSLPENNTAPKKVGIVMAGNVPLVGFHDFLCVFITGHFAMIKPSSKDEAMIKHIVAKLTEWDADVANWVQLSPMLKGCDAYIATGSNNTGRYFDYYFNKFPHIIRKNRTSVAVITGNETAEELEKLADDVYQYFGLGCRNVTKLYVPAGYDFVPLLEAFRKYDYLINHHKYKNNYDYNLAIHLLNNKYYMTNGSILLIENESPFSPISQLHYEYYNNIEVVQSKLKENDEVQCIVSKNTVNYGEAQKPQICDYADGVDTMQFLTSL